MYMCTYLYMYSIILDTHAGTYMYVYVQCTYTTANRAVAAGVSEECEGGGCLVGVNLVEWCDGCSEGVSV